MKTMFRIIFILAGISSFLAKPAIGQENNPGAIFRNDSFKFTIIRISPKFIDSNRIEPSITLVESSMSKRDREKIEKLKYSDWLKLLTNEKTDWVTNLYLYEIYRRDATIFENVKDIRSWRACCKKEDLDFWRKTLADSRPDSDPLKRN